MIILLCMHHCQNKKCLFPALVRCRFRETPPSYNFSWHNAPRRQYIVNLDADVEITVSSGETKVIRQGEVFFVEDTHGKLHVYIVDCDTVMLFQGKTGIL